MSSGAVDSKLPHLFALVCVAGASVFSLLNWHIQKKTNSDRIVGEIESYLEIRRCVKDKYIEPFNADLFHQSALEGAMSSLDEHSIYMSPEKSKMFQEATNAHFQGIGAEVELVNGKFIFGATWPGTPAYEAGVEAGDRILSVNGEKLPDPLTREEFNAIRTLKIRGNEGTNVQVTLERPEPHEIFDISVARRTVHVPSVRDTRILPSHPSLGYIRMERFSGDTDNSSRAENSVNEVINSIEQLEQQTPEKHLEGLIFDLRGNGGGLMAQAVAICRLFVKSGVIVSQKERSSSRVYIAEPKAVRWPDLPIILLIDGQSASASEIVAGCLRDHQRAWLVGEKSYGKASVQSTYEIHLPTKPADQQNPKGATEEEPNDGSSRSASIKLTIAKYLTPKGFDIHGNGIMPDIVVHLSRSEYQAIDEAQRTLFIESNRRNHRPQAEASAIKKLLDTDSQLTTGINLWELMMKDASPEARAAAIRSLAEDAECRNAINDALDASVKVYVERYVEFAK
jgi:carboxyl-terminal processing protease